MLIGEIVEEDVVFKTGEWFFDLQATSLARLRGRCLARRVGFASRLVAGLPVLRLAFFRAVRDIETFSAAKGVARLLADLAGRFLAGCPDGRGHCEAL